MTSSISVYEIQTDYHANVTDNKYSIIESECSIGSSFLSILWIHEGIKYNLRMISTYKVFKISTFSSPNPRNIK